MVVFLMDSQPEPARVARHAIAARRLRLEVPGLLGDKYLGRRLERTLETWPGVEEVRAEPRSGRVLVRYAPGAPLLGQLKEQPEPSRAPEPKRRALPGAVAPRRQPPWHALDVAEVLGLLRSGSGGLTHEEAAERLRRHGLNLVEEVGQRSRLAILGSQVANVPMGLLLGSAAVSSLTGDLLETAAILVVVGLNAGIGYRIESHNQELLSSWRKLEAGEVQVLRGGVLLPVSTAELVPGDVLLCRAGDVLPADVRVLDAHRLSCDESPLTGESEPQPKHASAVDEDAPLAERTSMMYAGTTVATGHGRSVVVATGRNTELARVRALVETAAAPADPLAKRLAQLDRRVAVGAVGAAALAGVAGALRGRSPRQVLRGAVALGVAALPEGLPLVSTAALVRSMQRLHRRGMVVRRVASAEALGGITVICTDKTGTLTYNQMRLEVVDLGRGPLEPGAVKAKPGRVLEDAPTLALATVLLNSDVDMHREGAQWVVSGSSTERALVSSALAAGLDGARLRRDFPRRELRERSEGVNYVVSLHGTPEGGEVAFVKGAPEQVLGLCTRDLYGPLDAAGRKRVLRRNEELADRGLRVLALAWRRIEPGRAPPRDGYTLIGLVGLKDTLREGAADSIRLARGAGIRTVILTGDQPRTAAAIAREVGLEGEALGVAELRRLLPLPDGELVKALDRVAVLARVTPEHKVALVRALRERGERVAMAGDGINDAPALKAADVGIAVGASATDLTRQVADAVMSSEDLRTIIAAVGEGRIVQDNLRRAMRFLFATNLSEMTLVVGAALAGLAEPLTPMQLLWLNLLTDTLPGIALALEPGDPDILDRPPAPPDAPLLSGAVTRSILRDGLLLAGVGAVGWMLGGPPLAFGTLTAAQLGYAAVCRAPRRARSPGLAQADLRFTAFVGGGAALQLAALTVPPLRRILGMPTPSPLSLGGFAVGLVLPSLLASSFAVQPLEVSP
uniref:Cation-transporting P-type ATPase n=1 Tax=Vitiosangium cumulatum TaxID=1867796 RepID=A0A7D5BTS8_9BACT|nr:cation-transporting P-type ATPase [Vitiosangium cumulatum]